MTKSEFNFLKTEGEVASLIQQHDWTNTSLGPVSSWAISLKTNLNLVLSSSVPMHLLWGENFHFYNDALLRALGKPILYNIAKIEPLQSFWDLNWPVMSSVFSQVKSSCQPVWKQDQTLGLPYHTGLRYFFLNAIPLFNDPGNFAGVLTSFFDTTQNHITVQKLKEDSAELNFAIEATELGTWDLNPATGKFTANDRLKSWFGLEPHEQVLLTSATDAVVFEDRDRVIASINRALMYESGGRYEEIYTIINPINPTPRIVLAKGKAMFNENRQPIRFNGTLQDITERVLAERAQNATNILIEDSRRQLLRSFDEAPVAIASIDKDQLTFSMVNIFYSEIAGRSAEELVGKPLLVALPELRGQGFDLLLEEVIKTGVPFSSKEVPVEIFRNNRLDKIYVDLVYQPQYDSRKEITGVLVVATDVTAQVISRRAIEESEARFRALIEEAPVGTCVFVGREMKVELANDAMLALWGKDKSALGKPLAAAVPELVGQPFLDILDEVYSTGITYTAEASEAKLIRDGSLKTYYFDFTYKALRNIDGEIYGIMDMAVDVTGQVEARKGLEESERFSRQIFDNSPVSKIVLVGDDLVVQTVNEAMLKMLGRNNSIIGKPLLQAVSELREIDIEEKYRTVITTGESHFEDAKRMSIVRNGETIIGYFDFILKPLFNTPDNVYGAVFTAIDVTQETTTRQKIESAENTLRGAIELAKLATWNIDIKSGTVHYSERLQSWLGIKQAVLELDRSPRIHPKDQKRVGIAMRRALLPGSNENFDETYTIVNAITGQEKIIHSSGIAKFDDNNNAISISGTARDVTLEQEMQIALKNEVEFRTEQLEVLNENLRRSNDELSQYAYVASHDLQEPLRKIRIFSEMLAKLPELPDVPLNYISKINESALRMTQLITDLLEFSSVVHSTQRKTQVDLNTIVEEAKKDFELLIAEKEAILYVEELPVIEGIKLQMNQLFFNLISNALKFSNKEVKPIIKIKSSYAEVAELKHYLRKPNPNTLYYKISVEDNGIGFEPQFADQIFEVFKRLHGRETYAGSGIGLALCRKIVTNHGGVLYAESELGTGTSFNILIPQHE